MPAAFFIYATATSASAPAFSIATHLLYSAAGSAYQSAFDARLHARSFFTDARRTAVSAPRLVS